LFTPASAGHLSTMADALAEVEPKAAQPQRGKNTLAVEAEKGKKKSRLLRTVPASLIKFRAFQNREKVQAGATPPVTKKTKENLEGPCGLGCIVIPSCQRLNNFHCFLFFYSLLITSQGIVFGLVDLSIDTFEKESHLNNMENLLLSLTYDISSCLIVLFIAYYGGRGNIPRWITFSSFLVGFGSLLFAFPYFSGGNDRASVDIEGIMEASVVLGYSLSYVIAASLTRGTENSIFAIRTGQLGNLTAPCNSHCKCSSSFYSTICGRDNIGYFSPCFAGCTQSKKLNDQQAYYNCSCIKEGLTTSDDQGDFIDARPGACDAKCYKLPLFIAFIFSTILFSVFSGIPCTLNILRIVSDNHRSLALGLTYVILRMFGTIPGPILFKMAGATSCIFRGTEYCGKTGRCWIYNKTKMAYFMVGICSICKVFTIFFTAIAFCLYKCLSKEDSNILNIPVKNLKVKKKGKN
uniref:Solute carrier organic anion transporter family member 6A1 n=1 Tax=Ursus maritimus TaxID=29073 RepID=A0A452UJ58_URSMA